MQQRQLRLGDILDDYCPRERRVTNHVIVAMIGEDVKQTRCTTCDADHEYKHAKVPRQRRKTETPAALYAQVLAAGPKTRRARERHDQRAAADEAAADAPTPSARSTRSRLPADDVRLAVAAEPGAVEADADEIGCSTDGGDRTAATRKRPVHRRLIRASLPRTEGAAAADPADARIHHPPAGRPSTNASVRGIRARVAAAAAASSFQATARTAAAATCRRSARRRHALQRRPAAAGPRRRRHGRARHGPGGRKRSK